MSFVDILVPFESEEKLEPARPRKTHAAPEPTSEFGSNELVEALFLEARKPIVAFDAQKPELVAVRLLSAFWPAFRSNFSLCTHAIGMRKLAGREFDLLFAPKEARSRFSEWKGRKLEMGSSKPPRHRWSPLIARSIFLTTVPSLVSDDPLGLLAVDSKGDEGAFRKTLLWNELAGKVTDTPSAVLGMLDIVNSQPGVARKAMSAAGALISAGVSNAVRVLPAAEAWQFLDTLHGKAGDRKELLQLADYARDQASNLASTNPDAAMIFTKEFANPTRPLPHRILEGMAEGLGATHTNIDSWDFPSRVGAFLLGSAPSFAATVAGAIRSGILPAKTIVDYFNTGDVGLEHHAAQNLLAEVDGAEFAPLIPVILSHAADGERGDWIKSLLQRSAVAVPVMDEPIMDAIRDDVTMTTVRDFVASSFDGADADRFLTRTLRLLPHDVEWLFSTALAPERSTKLLVCVMSKHDDRSLIEAQRDDRVRKMLLEMLSRDAPIGAGEIARLLLLGAQSVDDLLDFGGIALGHLPDGETRSGLLGAVLQRAFLQADPSDVRISRVLSEHFDEVGARQVIWWSTDAAVVGSALSRNLAVIARMPIKHRRSVEAHIDELSERLGRRPAGQLDTDAYAAWANLLWESRSSAPTPYVRAASIALSATIGMTSFPVSEVVAAAFPGVYRELTQMTEDEPDGLLGIMMSIPMLFVGSWDHAKPARHGLVDAFLASNWPPSHLLLAAARAGILDRICLRLTRQKGGKKYLDRATGDLSRLNQADVRAIREQTRSFSVDRMQDDWD